VRNRTVFQDCDVGLAAVPPLGFFRSPFLATLSPYQKLPALFSNPRTHKAALAQRRCFRAQQ
jgi:hypothetical protein